MNKNTWASLPPDIQKIVEAINAEWIPKSGATWDEYDKAGRNFALKLGNKMIPLSKEEDARWAQKVAVTFDDYIKDTKKKGFQGKRCSNSVKTF